MITVFKNLSLDYNSKNLLNNVNLDINDNSWVTILGKSASGKSTLLRIIAGLETFCKLSGTHTKIKNISWMGQTDMLYPWLSILDNAVLNAKLNSKLNNNIIDEAKKLLNKVGITNDFKQYPNELSGGGRQRLALVRSILSGGDVILMDEPFSALDAITRHEISILAKNLFKNKTVIMITHDIDEAINLSDEIYVVSNKTLVGPMKPNQYKITDLKNNLLGLINE